MIREKTYTKKVFDDEVFKPGVKISAKYRNMISSDKQHNYWDYEIDNGEVIKCQDEYLYIKDLDNGHYEEFYGDEEDKK